MEQRFIILTMILAGNLIMKKPRMNLPMTRIIFLASQAKKRSTIMTTSKKTAMIITTTMIMTTALTKTNLERPIPLPVS